MLKKPHCNWLKKKLKKYENDKREELIVEQKRDRGFLELFSKEGMIKVRIQVQNYRKNILVLYQVNSKIFLNYGRNSE